MSLSFGGSKQKSSTNETQNTSGTSTYNPSAGFMNLLNPALQQAREGQYQAFDPSTIAQYQNPYTQQVIDSTVSRLGQANAENNTALNGQAAAAGAFGGSGWGLLRANADQNYQDTLASTVAGLNQQGFNQAQQIAQGENANANAYGLNQQQAYAQLLSLLGNWGTTNQTGTGTRSGTSKGSGMNFGANFTYGGG